MSGSEASVISATLPGAPRARTFSLDDLKEQRSEKLVWMFYGDKDTGKTIQPLDIPGRHLVISLDDKTKGVKDGMFGVDQRIWVVNGIQHYSSLPELAPQTAADSIDFILWAIRKISATFHPHWVMFDGVEMLNKLCDNKMRHMHGLKSSQGFAERVWWKDRNAALDELFNTARACSESGLIGTVYYAKVFSDEGSVKSVEKMPAYVGRFHEATDITIETRGDYSTLSHSKRYTAYVQSAKPHLYDIAHTGETHDVTWTRNEDGTLVPKHFPFGPGLAARIAKVDQKLKGVAIEYPTESTVPAEQTRIFAELPVEAAVVGVPSDVRAVAEAMVGNAILDSIRRATDPDHGSVIVAAPSGVTATQTKPPGAGRREL